MVKPNFTKYLFLFFPIIFLSCFGKQTTLSFSNEDGIDSTDQIIKIEYGLVTNDFEVFRGTIEPNQFLADILLKYHVPYPEIDKLVKKAKGIFDVRSIMSGKSYVVFTEKDSTGKAKCFIYEPSATEFIVFDLRDSINVYKGEKDVETIENFAGGIINSSLYQTLSDEGASPALAVELANIFAWTIDFYRIQKGDAFKVVYEEKYVDGNRIGIGQIKAAVFTHKGEDFYAFPFEQDGIKDFFDEKGQGLRKAFLKSPLKFGRLSSAYSPKRFHPVQKTWKPHLGTDYAAPTGTPILATGDGKILEARYSKFNGNYVKIQHNGTYTTQYLHMSKIGKGIKPGVRVKQGDVIGYVGSTGLATGPHVCYRFWKNGKQVDHRKEKLPAAFPVKDAYKARFFEHIDSLKIKLKHPTPQSEV